MIRVSTSTALLWILPLQFSHWKRHTQKGVCIVKMFKTKVSLSRKPCLCYICSAIMQFDHCLVNGTTLKQVLSCMTVIFLCTPTWSVSYTFGYCLPLALLPCVFTHFCVHFGYRLFFSSAIRVATGLGFSVNGMQYHFQIVQMQMEAHSGLFSLEMVFSFPSMWTNNWTFTGVMALTSPHVINSLSLFGLHVRISTCHSSRDCVFHHLKISQIK